MSQEQKMAWLMVGTFAAGVVLFLVLIPVLGIPAAFSGFGLTGLGGLGPLVFCRKRKPDMVPSDERDKMIGQKATLVGAMISYETFILACMIPWGIYYFGQGKELISVHALPLIVGAGGLAFFVSRSILLLIFYGREGRHGEE